MEEGGRGGKRGKEGGPAKELIKEEKGKVWERDVRMDGNKIVREERRV